MNRNVIYIILGSTLLFGLVTFLLFEFKEVPDVNWRKTYLPTSKEPYGTWMFRQMLDERYGADNVYDRYKEIELSEIDTTEKALLFMIGRSIDLDYTETNSLGEFINAGHDIFISSSRLNFNYDWGPTDYRVRYKQDTSINMIYPSYSDNSYQYTFRDRSFEASSNQYYRYFLSGDLKTHSDSSHTKLLLKEIELSQEIQDILTSEEEDIEVTETDYGYIIGITEDSLGILKEWHFEGGGFVNIHLMPDIFTNDAAHQIDYLDHFNEVIGQFSYDKIIFEHPSFNTEKTDERESPIQFILGDTSLKKAYYLLLVAALLFILFRGKRKQKVIPTIAENKNTSLEYINTLGRLYEYQNQPRKLVTHMANIFHHDIKKKYFIDRNDPEFNKKLAAKSKIPKADIDIIMRTFETIMTRYDFNDNDLSLLYRRIDTFYKNCK